MKYNTTTIKKANTTFEALVKKDNEAFKKYVIIGEIVNSAIEFKDSKKIKGTVGLFLKEQGFVSGIANNYSRYTNSVILASAGINSLLENDLSTADINSLAGAIKKGKSLEEYKKGKAQKKAKKNGSMKPKTEKKEEGKKIEIPLTSRDCNLLITRLKACNLTTEEVTALEHLALFRDLLK